MCTSAIRMPLFIPTAAFELPLHSRSASSLACSAAIQSLRHRWQNPGSLELFHELEEADHVPVQQRLLEQLPPCATLSHAMDT